MTETQPVQTLASPSFYPVLRVLSFGRHGVTPHSSKTLSNKHFRETTSKKLPISFLLDQPLSTAHRIALPRPQLNDLSSFNMAVKEPTGQSDRVGDDRQPEETPNPLALAIVPSDSGRPEEASAERAAKEEVESKISAWETAEIAKITSRFKRQEVIINGWEEEQVERATAALRKVERKLEERRARAVEKMQNEVAIARRKADERRAAMEATKGERAARVLESSKLMRVFGRGPSKRVRFLCIGNKYL